MGRISRKTRQKEAIANAIASSSTFFTAEDLHEQVQKSSIGTATIYRYLKQAKERGEVHPYACGDRTIYSSKQESHCHFICEKTGEITHFTVKNLDFLEGKIPGKVTSFQIEVRGICEDACESCEDDETS